MSECGRAKLGLEYDNIERDGPECGSVKENDGPTVPVQLEPECGYEMETECGMTNKTIPEYGSALQENEKMEIDCDPAQLYERVSLRKRKRSGKMRYRLKRVVGWDGTECGKSMVSDCGPSLLSKAFENEIKWPRRSRNQSTKIRFTNSDKIGQRVGRNDPTQSPDNRDHKQYRKSENRNENRKGHRPKEKM